MSIIDIEKWKAFFQYVIEYFHAIALGVFVSCLALAGIYVQFLAPKSIENPVMPVYQQENLESLRQELAKLRANESNLRRELEGSCLRRNVAAVFVDAYGKFTGYRKEDRVDGRSNAHYLVEQISELKQFEGIKPKAESVALNGSTNSSQIIALKPDIVVIHRSTFENHKDGADARLKQLIGELNGSVATVIVYSRSSDTDETYSRKLINTTAFKGRLFVYKFQVGNPFEDPSVVRQFLLFVDSMGRAAACTSSNT